MVGPGYVPARTPQRAASRPEEDDRPGLQWHADAMTDERSLVVRRAEYRDRDAVVATAYAAFRTDPGWGYLFGSDYDRLVGPFVTVLFEQRVRAGTAWITDDASAVALWDPPGGSQTVPDATAWKDYEALAGATAWGRLQAYDAAVHAAQQPGNFWYLGILATHPTRQGQGLASAVMAPALERADADALPCGLETSTQQNRAFYEKRGFTQAVEVDLPDAPTTWWLTRPPRRTS
jgi:GNAT superfamily N-acetyltransferase